MIFRSATCGEKIDHTWAAFGPKANGYRHVAHQTIALNANGVDVFVNVELARVLLEGLRPASLRTELVFAAWSKACSLGSHSGSRCRSAGPNPTGRGYLIISPSQEGLHHTSSRRRSDLRPLKRLRARSSACVYRISP